MDSTAPQTCDITAVGHFSIDSITLPNRPHAVVILGGAVAYVSLVARRLDKSASVISKVGADFPEAYVWWLQQEGIDLSGVVRLQNEQTTRFDLEYSNDLSNRLLGLKSRASPINLNDLPNSLRARAIHIAPIAGEIPYEVVEHLKQCADVLSLDPQGLLRSFDEFGNVTCCSPVDKRLLSLIDIFKSSQDEISALTGQSDLDSAIGAVHDYGVKTVLVTLGAKGAVLSAENAIFQIPTCDSAAVVDPTGAGDVFIGGFLAEHISQKDSLWCACVGSAAASIVIEGIGPTFLGEKEEIYRRARFLYEKEIKQ